MVIVMMIKVQITKDVPEFVGLSGGRYGPFFANTVIWLPFEIAILLIKNHYAIVDREWLKNQVQSKGTERVKAEFIERLKKMKEKRYTFVENLTLDNIIPPAIFENIEKELSKVPRYLTVQELLNILGTTIKHDNVNKLITFLAMLCTYTEDSQFNVSFRAPSSTGKSYIPLEIASYFPEEDLRIIAYSSPTAFYHDTGEWDSEKRAIVIDLA